MLNQSPVKTCEGLTNCPLGNSSRDVECHSQVMLRGALLHPCTPIVLTGSAVIRASGSCHHKAGVCQAG